MYCVFCPEAVISERGLSLSKRKEDHCPFALLDRFGLVPAARKPRLWPVEACHRTTVLDQLGMNIYVFCAVIEQPNTITTFVTRRELLPSSMLEE